MSIAQSEGVQVQQRSKSLASSLGGGGAGGRSSSEYASPLVSPLSATMPMQQQQHTQPNHPMKKKNSLPSLVGQGYTFGSVPTTSGNAPIQGMENGTSPYSELAPTLRIPPVPSPHAQAGLRNSPLAANGNSSGPAGIHWRKSFDGRAASPGETQHGIDSDDENSHSMQMQADVAPHIRGASASYGSGSAESRDRLGALPSSPARENGIPSGYNLGRRTSVSAESIDPSSLSTSAHPLPKTVIPKTASQRSRIEASIEKNLLFRNLDEDQHTDVLNAMKEVRVTKGTEVIVQGAVGDFFYVVESGDFQVWVKPTSNPSGMNIVTSPTATAPAATGRARSTSAAPEDTSADGGQHAGDDAASSEDGPGATRRDGSKLVASIPAGGSFGELALMYNAPRAATVVCHSATATLWALDRITFRTILMEHTSKKRRMYEKFLSEVPILVSLEAHERSKIADALEERVYEEGEDVVREGELGKNFYIIESGKAEVLKKKGDARERVGTLSKGDYFGGEYCVSLRFTLFSKKRGLRLTDNLCVSLGCWNRTGAAQLCPASSDRPANDWVGPAARCDARREGLYAPARAGGRDSHAACRTQLRRVGVVWSWSRLRRRRRRDGVAHAVDFRRERAGQQQQWTRRWAARVGEKPEGGSTALCAQRARVEGTPEGASG